MINLYLKLKLKEKIFFTPAILFVLINILFLFFCSIDVLLYALFSSDFTVEEIGKGYFISLNPFPIDWKIWLKGFIGVFLWEMIGLIYLSIKRI